MTYPALSAFALTQYSLTEIEQTRLSSEITLTERAIRFAARRGRYRILYDARIVGNPATSPSNTLGLTNLQLAYRNALSLARYVVQMDPGTGYWEIQWGSTGAETLVTVYTVRTTLTPGAIQSGTIAAVENYVETISPPATAKTVVNTAGAGGDIDETDFGAPASVFYEYTIVMRQTDQTDHSAGLLAALIGSNQVELKATSVRASSSTLNTCCR